MAEQEYIRRGSGVYLSPHVAAPADRCQSSQPSFPRTGSLQGTYTRIEYDIDPASGELALAVSGISRWVDNVACVICRYEARVLPDQDSRRGISDLLRVAQGAGQPSEIDGSVLHMLFLLTEREGITWQLTTEIPVQLDVMPHAPIPERFCEFVEDPSITQTMHAVYKKEGQRFTLRGRLQQPECSVPFVILDLSSSDPCPESRALLSIRHPLSPGRAPVDAFDLLMLFKDEGPRGFQAKVQYERECQQRALYEREQRIRVAEETIRTGEIAENFDREQIVINDELRVVFQRVGDAALVRVERQAGSYPWWYSWVMWGPNLAESLSFSQFCQVFQDIKSFREPFKGDDIKALCERLQNSHSKVKFCDEWPGELSDIVGFQHAETLLDDVQERCTVTPYQPSLDDERLTRILVGRRGVVLRLAGPSLEDIYPDTFHTLELHADALGYWRVMLRNSLGGHMRVLAKGDICSDYVGEIVEQFVNQLDGGSAALRATLEEVADVEVRSLPGGGVARIPRFVTNVPPPHSASREAYNAAVDVARVYTEIAGVGSSTCEVVWNGKKDTCTLSIGRAAGAYRLLLDILGSNVIGIHVNVKIPRHSFRHSFEGLSLPVTEVDNPHSALNTTLRLYQAFMKQEVRSLSTSDLWKFLQEGFPLQGG